MKRRNLFRAALAAPALVVVAPQPAAKASTLEEQIAALKMIDDWAEGHFGAVTDGIKRAWQTHLIYDRPPNAEFSYDRFPKVVDYVTRINQLFFMVGYNKPGVPDVLAKAVIAWINSTLGGNMMHKGECPTSRLIWRMRPYFVLKPADFETGGKGGYEIKIRARAHTWNGFPDFRRHEA